MPNVIPVPTHSDDLAQEEHAWPFPGGVIGFVSYWFALAITFLLYGANTLFFFLYTWPFFLTMLPVAVLVGIALNMVLRGRLLWTLIVTMLVVACLFWLLFSFLTGW